MNTLPCCGRLSGFPTCRLPSSLPPCAALAVARTAPLERGSHAQTPRCPHCSWGAVHTPAHTRHGSDALGARAAWLSGMCVCWETRAAGCKAFWQGRFHGCSHPGGTLTASLGVPHTLLHACVAAYTGTGRGTWSQHDTHQNHSCKHKRSSS